MEIKTLLNEYEYDWAAFPAFCEDFPAEKLKNKSVLITGGHLNFARCVLFSILTANDLKNLGITVSFLAGEEYIDEIPDGIIGRSDFRYYVFGTEPEQLPRVDVVISTGLCNKAIDESVLFFKHSVEAMKYVLSVVEKTGAHHFVLFSDYRVYGKTERGVFISEHENGKVSFSKSAAEVSVLLQTMEAQCVAAAKSCSFDFTILRCAIMLGASAGLDDSIISDMLKSVAVGDEYSVINSNNKYSFVYLSDVLNSMYHSITDMRKNTVYNVVGKRSTVSTGMLAAMLHDFYPDKANIKLINSENDPAYGAAMNNRKITVSAGLKPKISLEEAVQLVVRSYRHGNDIFKFDDSTQEKVESTHNVLLLYLLEVDRICRRHHIKYFLAGTTLLGAIRHKGFVPWSDYAGVMMLREDYNKFLNAVQDERQVNITMYDDVDFDTDSAIVKHWMDKAIFPGKFADMQKGVFFEVIALDRTSNRKLARKFHLKLTSVLRSVIFNKLDNQRSGDGDEHQNPVSKVIYKILPFGFLEKLHSRCRSWFEDKQDARYLYDEMGHNACKDGFPKKWLKDTVYWDFEGYSFPVPKDYDKYLKYLYGDYNNLALASQRKPCRDIIDMDFGEYCTALRPEHTYHPISITQTISDTSELPKKYPKRSDTPFILEEKAVSSTAAERKQPDIVEDDVKVFIPKKKKTEQAGSEQKTESESEAVQQQEGRVSVSVDYSSDSDNVEKAMNTVDVKENNPVSKRTAPSFDETAEFVIHQTDISHYNSSGIEEQSDNTKPEDTKEFELITSDNMDNTKEN